MEKKHRLAYVVNSLNPGGAERLVVDMALQYRERYSVAVICLDAPGEWADRLRSRDVPVYCLWRQDGFDLSIPFKLARLLRQLDCHLVHAHQTTPWIYTALSRLIRHRPKLLFEEHGRFYPETRKPRRVWVNRHLVRRLTDLTVAVCDDIRQRLDVYEGLDANLIEVIHNGVEQPAAISPAERDACRKSFGFSPCDFVVGSVGRLDGIKNFPMLVQAVSEARELSSSAVDTSIKGVIIGDGPESEALTETVREYQLTENFALPGYRADARKIVQCLDMFVLTSWSEGISMSLLEAMASGVCVAVTDAGGNPDVVRHRQDGWLVTPGSADELAAVIQEVACSPELRVEFGHAAAKRFRSGFTFSQMVDAYHLRYQALLG